MDLITKIKSSYRLKLTLIISLIITVVGIISALVIIIGRTTLYINKMKNQSTIFANLTNLEIINIYKFKHNSLPIPENLIPNFKEKIKFDENFVCVAIITAEGEILFKIENPTVKRNYEYLERIQDTKILDLLKQKEYFILENTNISFLFKGKSATEEGITVLKPYVDSLNQYNFTLIYLFNYDELRKSINEIIALILVIFIAFIVAGIFLSSYIARMLTRPLMELNEGVKVVSESRFDHKIAKTSEDEIGELVDTFNMMTNKLKESFDRINDYNLHLIKMVEERSGEIKKAYEEISVKNVELEKVHKRIQKELLMARKIQEAILPQWINKIEDPKISSIYLCMEEIGGDYYDVFKFNNELYGFLIADVTGHGVPAALVTTMTKVIFYECAKAYRTAGETCTLANKILCNYIGDTKFFVTAYYIIYDKQNQKLQYCSCGHLPALYYSKKNDNVNKLLTDGSLLGVFKERIYDTNYLDATSGDKIFLYTDGLIEAVNSKKDFFSEQRLCNIIYENKELSPEKLNAKIIENWEEFSKDTKRTDDIAILSFEVS